MPQTVERKMVRSWTEELEALGTRLSAHFARSEVRQRARDYLHGLLSGAERKNSWQLAEVAGNATPYGLQHLLGRASWDADALRDDVRGSTYSSVWQATRAFWSSTRRASSRRGIRASG